MKNNKKDILRKKILQEIKKLLNERTVEELAAAFASGAKSVSNIADVSKELKAALGTEMTALEQAGKDIGRLKGLYDNVGTIKNADEFMDALGQARAYVQETKASAATASAAGAAGAAEVKAAEAGATAAGSTAKQEAQITQEISSATPQRIKELSDLADKDLRSMKATDTISEADFNAAMQIKNQLSQVPGFQKVSRVKEFLSKNAERCKQNKKMCGAIIAGVLGVAAVSYFGFKRSSSDVSPTPPGPGGDGPTPSGGDGPPTPPGGDGPPTPPVPGGGDEATFSPSGKSFKCKDINSVIKFQRYLKNQGKKVFVDGNYGAKTHAAALSYFTDITYTFADLKADPAKAKDMCNRISQPGMPWKDESTKKDEIPGKKPAEKGGKEGGSTWYPYTLVAPKYAQYLKIPSKYFSELDSIAGGRDTIPGSEVVNPLRFRLVRDMINSITDPEAKEIIDNEFQSDEDKFITSFRKTPASFQTEALEETWHKRHQTTYSSNLFERLVKSINKKVL